MSLRRPSEKFNLVQQQPLIDRCTNEWREKSEDGDLSPFSSDERWLEPVSTLFKQAWAVVKAPKFQRVATLLVLTTIASLVFWHSFLASYLAQSRAAWESINAESDAKKGNVFGVNKRVHLPGITHIMTLDAEHLPRSSKANPEKKHKDKRLVFIGDIHGHMKELELLLSKVKYSPATDHIVALGDMINKGPDSLGVVDYLMEQRASCVRGNHEDRILLHAKDLAGATLKKQPGYHDLTNGAQETNAEKLSREERELAASLSHKQLAWLGDCPVMLRIGDLEHFGEIVAVHGGLVPGVRLQDQDPLSVMNMRIVDLKTHVPSHKHSLEGSVLWAEFWNRYQELMPAQNTLFGHQKTKHTTVVYGHDAKKGLQIKKYTKGLDSGCGNGNALTAWVVGDLGKNEVVQVKCGSSHKNTPNDLGNILRDGAAVE